MEKYFLKFQNEQYSSRPPKLQNTTGLIKMSQKKKKKSLQSLNDKNNPQTLVVLLLSIVLNYEDV